MIQFLSSIIHHQLGKVKLKLKLIAKIIGIWAELITIMLANWPALFFNLFLTCYTRAQFLPKRQIFICKRKNWTYARSGKAVEQRWEKQEGKEDKEMGADRGAGSVETFYSNRCRQEYYRKQRQEKPREQWRVKQFCPNCGWNLNWTGAARPGVFAVRSVGKNCGKSITRQTHPRYRERANVVNCGKEFTNDRWSGGKYCSQDCYLHAIVQTKEDRICVWFGELFSIYARNFSLTRCSTRTRPHWLC